MRLYSEGQAVVSGKDILVCVKGGDKATFVKLEGDKLSDKEIVVVNNTNDKGFKDLGYNVSKSALASDLYFKKYKLPAIKKAKEAKS